MGIYDSVDLLWDKNGDYVVDSTGDIADTSSDYLLSLEQEAFSVLQADIGDWRSNPNFAASLKDFIGELNTAENGAALESRIRSSLAINNVAAAKDIYVRAVPVRPDGVLCVIVISVTPTVYNRLGSNGEVSLSFMFSVESGTIVYVEAEKAINLFPI